MVSTLFPVTFGDGALLCSDELHDGSLVCAGDGPTAYAMARAELEFYFGAELVAELDALAGRSAARERASGEEGGSGAGRGERVAAAVPRGAVLLLSYAAQEGRGTGTVGEGAEDAQRILAVNSDAGGKAVQVHSHSRELREQLLESSLVSHAIHHSRHRVHALATTAHV